MKFAAKGVNDMTVRQIIRLIEWLKEEGYTIKEIQDCLNRIANKKDD